MIIRINKKIINKKINLLNPTYNIRTYKNIINY